MQIFLIKILTIYSSLLHKLGIRNRWILRPSQYLYRPFSILQVAKLKYSGVKIEIDLSDFIGFYLFVKGSFEEHNLEATLNYGIKDKTIIDIGANIGSFGFNLAHEAKHIVMIEASPFLCEKLNATAQHNELKNITIVNKAVSDKTGQTLQLFQGIRTKGDNSLIQGSANTAEFEPVTTETLDDIVDRLGIIPDFIKIDVEGFELKLLKGAINTISKFRPAILMEWNGRLIHKQGLSLTDFFIFSDQNYKAHIIQKSGSLIFLNQDKLNALAKKSILCDLIFIPEQK